jgi:hypothetical protein
MDGRNYRKSNYGKKKSKEWLNNNSERMKELQSNWFKNNRDYIYEKTNNRLRNDPILRFIKNQRKRINNAIKSKTKKTIEYLGCNSEKFFHWISYNFDEVFTFDNYGTVWHIDHVIPISKFNIEDSTHLSQCFNWRNTIPLLVRENLSKNNRLISSQIEQHLEKLNSYHKEKNIEMPQEFIDLFAKCLVVRGPP